MFTRFSASALSSRHSIATCAVNLSAAEDSLEIRELPLVRRSVGRQGPPLAHAARISVAIGSIASLLAGTAGCRKTDPGPSAPETAVVSIAAQGASVLPQPAAPARRLASRSDEHTSEVQSPCNLV